MASSRRLFCLACLALAASAQAPGPVVVLIGAPGAGKTTQADLLRKDFGMAVVSVEDLIAQNRQAFERFRRPEIQGVEPRVDPALNRLVEAKLRSMDLSKGVVLDGYPAAKAHGDYLTTLTQTLRLPKPVVIHLQTPDAVARQRLKQESLGEVEQRLKDYHRELDFARLYFPEADIHDVDGTRSPAEVSKEIRRILKK